MLGIRCVSDTFSKRRVWIFNHAIVIRKVIQIGAAIYPTACFVADESARQAAGKSVLSMRSR
ncbi:hypothetical protein, partial [Clostridioides difficile]|uniref:hypothetical protein n=1 Tax=Clostridioides difficile TaxID=1496 RepID=UPI0021088A06